MRIGSDGDPSLDFSRLSRDHGAALIEVTVEDFKDGRGENARDVRRVKFKLADKRAALVDIGKELGMFIDHKRFEILPLEQRLAQMTDEQRMEEAKQLAARIRRRLDEDIAKNGPLIEVEATEVEG